MVTFYNYSDEQGKDWLNLELIEVKRDLYEARPSMLLKLQ